MLLRILALSMGLVAIFGSAYPATIAISQDVDFTILEAHWAGAAGSKYLEPAQAGSVLIDVNVLDPAVSWSVMVRAEVLLESHPVEIFITNDLDNIARRVDSANRVAFAGIGDSTVMITYELRFPQGLPPEGDALRANIVYSIEVGE